MADRKAPRAPVENNGVSSPSEVTAVVDGPRRDDPGSPVSPLPGDDARECTTTLTETGPEVIARILKTLPGSPGVYRMIDGASEVIYVGKARSLKKRVQSYARLGGHTQRIARMIAATASMEFVVTRTESEALLLEANLIKRFRPRFNVLLRDDKSFPYILIAGVHAAPQIVKHRGARKRKGEYFGPFASAGAVVNTINTLQRAFLLRTCSDSFYESRTRPCLLYQIKRCSAPCTGEISLEVYGRLVEEATRFLRGESQSVRHDLQALMAAAAERQDYELAAQYRNRLQAISHVQQFQGINPEGIEEADVFAAYQEGGVTCIQVFFFRTGQNWGNRAYFPRADRSLAPEEVLDAFIAQFYDDKPVPRLILLSSEIPNLALMEEALSLKAERKVEIRVPRRGDKTDLIEHALANAREALGRRLAESSTQHRLLEGLGKVFGLSEAPRRVEVYDNSHIQGANAIGAMIVAGPDGFVKGQYRKFNMKAEGLAAGDDFAMMREVLRRRFSRLLKEHGEAAPVPDKAGISLIEAPNSLDLGIETAQNSGPQADLPAEALDENEEGSPTMEELPEWPDLVLIDGGKGQLSAALGILKELGIAGVAVAGIAKGPDRDAGREHFHIAGREPFMLEPRDPVLYFVQRLRDEAHRFAIGTHRAKRRKEIGANPLDEVAGIGPTRKRALLKHFGSAKAVSRAGVADLLKVSGISEAMAQTIYDHFHEREG
jgi:excinuclease ABC subunit C